MHLPILLIFLLAFAAQTAVAWAGWNVAMVKPDVRYALDGQTWRPVSKGMELPGSAWIHTGPRGRVLLERSGELIQFKPNTVAAVTSPGESGPATVIVKFGASILDTPPGRRTRVETPYLGAMVKGTHFEVEVTLRLARLRVGRGVVEVTHLQRGERVDVGPGQQVTVLARSGAPFRFEGYGRQVRITRVPPRDALVQPARPSAPWRAGDDLTEHDGDEPLAFEGPEATRALAAERVSVRARDARDPVDETEAEGRDPASPEDEPAPREDGEEEAVDEEDGGEGGAPGDTDDGGSPIEGPVAGQSPA